MLQVPLELSFHNLPQREETVELIYSEVEKLERIYERLVSARVAVEAPHKHPRRGSGYRVRIELGVPPGHRLAVDERTMFGSVQDELRTVIRRAFRAAERQLRRIQQQQQGRAKSHPTKQIQGFVRELFDDHGFIRTLDGRDVYFHANSVLHDGFEALEPGNGVAFLEHRGEQGPQASSVQVVDHRGHAPPETEDHARPQRSDT